jgi:ABC-type Zn uptake system ZnuABC Zn-binding protein ZnuA
VIRLPHDRRLVLALIAAVALLTAGACSGGGGDSKSFTSQDQLGANNKLNVVTSVAPLTDIVRNIGGDRINLYGIIPDGVDSHSFEPKPSDAKVLSKADLVILNGLHLEDPTLKLAQANLKQGAEIKLLGDNTIGQQDWIYDFSFPKDKGNPNPHVWMNPQYALHYAQLTRDWLAAKDAANADYYRANFDRFKAQIDQLDAAIRTAIQTVPESNRKLLTYHDSWAYWAREYGFTVIGAIQPSDFKEPRPQEVAALIDQIKKEGVPAVFGSEVFPSKVLEQIARESGARYVDKLRDDEPPGKPGDPNHTYVGMMVFDMQTMLTALGGNADALSSINPADVYQKST